MHKHFKDRLYVIENGPGGVRWYTNGHFALSENVVTQARGMKGLKYLQELPPLRAGTYYDSKWSDVKTPDVAAILPTGPLSKVRSTGLTVESNDGGARSVFVVGKDTVSLLASDYAALLCVASVLESADNLSPIVGRLSDDGPIEILVMPIRNDGFVKIRGNDKIEIQIAA